LDTDGSVMRIKYFAAYNSNGTLAGLYNSLEHKAIPKNSVEITSAEREEIVRTPGAFSVVNHKLKKDVVWFGAISSDSAARNQYKSRINKGIPHNGVIYSASTEASAHITQCLVLIQLDPTFVPELFVLNTVSGHYFVAVDKDTLITVARQVNKIRLGAAIDLNYELGNIGGV
jgi:hypothetical protein